MMLKLGRGLIRGWMNLFRRLGQSVLDLLRAELDQLLAELGITAKQAAIGLAFFAAAGMVGFWFLWVFTYFLIQVVAIWLPHWAAAGIAVLVLLIAVAVLALLGLRKFKGLENPVDTVGRRFDDHLDWWENRLLAEERVSDEPVGTESREELS